mmetsp:Transcript_11856/g.21979  ORF Transcript_11856/g.21979 Transcript_11856/m.21979 type:complete len:176 (-) Transcript_11856:471-998(-)
MNGTEETRSLESGTDGIELLLASISEALQKLVEGLAKRVEGSEVENEQVQHAARRKVLLEAMEPNFFGRDQQKKDSYAQLPNAASSSEQAEDDESKDADLFAQAFQGYKDVMASLLKLVDGVEQNGAESLFTRASEEDIGRLEALRKEAKMKNDKMKLLIDRLRYLRQHLSMLKA